MVYFKLILLNLKGNMVHSLYTCNNGAGIIDWHHFGSDSMLACYGIFTRLYFGIEFAAYMTSRHGDHWAHGTGMNMVINLV